jgi:hypothetical protein
VPGVIVMVPASTVIASAEVSSIGHGDPLRADVRLAPEEDDRGDLNVRHDDVPEHDQQVFGDLERALPSFGRSGQ